MERRARLSTPPPPAGGIERYEFVRSLGSGGMGSVFEVRSRHTGASLAIKALKDPNALVHFKHEFRALSELSHPNVVRFVELFEDRGEFYLTMELVRGDDFLSHVRSATSSPDGRAFASTVRSAGVEMPEPREGGVAGGQLDVPRLRAALRQLVSGLMALHASGLIHRDVKPPNILVTSEGRLVLLDFGLVIDRDGPQPHELAGTIPYMAPEQVLGLPLSASADWYSVGVVLYEALTGALPPPHYPPRPSAPPPEDPRVRAPSVPDDLSELCLRLLEADAASRATEEEIARVLGLHVQTERGRASFRSQLHFSRSVFVNRHAESEQLREAFAASRRTGGIVSITGESGVGKSALVRRFIASACAEDPSIVALSGRCYEREIVPFRGIDLMVDALAEHLRARRAEGRPLVEILHGPLLAEVFPVLRALPEFAVTLGSEFRRLDPQEARRLAFGVFKGLLHRLAVEAPVLLHVDDAQWLDEESVALLSFVMLEADAPPVLLLLTERTWRSDAVLALERKGGDLRRVVLGPLTPDDSRALAGQLLAHAGAGSNVRAEVVAERSGGHPLFIHELVLHGSDANESGTLDGAIRSRVAAIGPVSRRLLQIVALAAAPLAHEVARRAAQLSAADYPWVLTTLRSENLLTFHGFAPGDEVAVYHDRIRSVVAEDIGPVLRRALHAVLAECMEAETPEDLDALAHHSSEAGLGENAARYARAGAERALGQLAFEQAARLCRLALQTAPPAEQLDLEMLLGSALGNAGRGVEAAEAYLRATARAEGGVALELRRRAGEQLLRAGYVTRGLSLLRDILAELGEKLPRRDVEIAASLLFSLGRLQMRGLRARPSAAPLSASRRLRIDTCWTLGLGISMVHHLLATDFQARTLLLALDAGDDDFVFRAMAMLGTNLSMTDGLGRRLGRRLTERTEALHAAEPSLQKEAWLCVNRAVACMADWDFAGCEEHAAKAEQQFRESGSGGWELVTAQAFTLWAMAFQGRFSVASARLPELLASAEARGDRHAIGSLVLSPLHLIGLAEDEPARVRRSTQRVIREWPDELAFFQHQCAEYVFAQVDLYEGSAESAWKHVVTAWKMLRRGHLSRVQFQRVDLLGLRGRAALARAAEASRLRKGHWLEQARMDAERLAAEGLPAALALSALLHGGVDSLNGDPRAAARHFDAARMHFLATGMKLHAAIALLARGSVLGEADGTRRALDELAGLSVKNPRRMLGLWVPGRAFAENSR